MVSCEADVLFDVQMMMPKQQTAGNIIQLRQRTVTKKADGYRGYSLSKAFAYFPADSQESRGIPTKGQIERILNLP
jgi:hypothetical protein